MRLIVHPLVVATSTAVATGNVSQQAKYATLHPIVQMAWMRKIAAKSAYLTSSNVRMRMDSVSHLTSAAIQPMTARMVLTRGIAQGHVIRMSSPAKMETV